MSSRSDRWTAAQINGVTDTSTDDGSCSDEPGSWQQDVGEYLHVSSEFLIPGKGQPGNRCGEWTPGQFCDESGHVIPTENRCQRRECPHCWGFNAHETTVRAVSRLGAARHISHPRAVHVAVSPPEGSVESVDAFYEARSRAVDLAREAGVRGGLMVAHGFRIREEIQDEFEDVDSDMGIWMWVRENDRDWRSQVYWSPHFHVVGLAEDVDGDTVQEIYKESGWVIRNIERGCGSSLEEFRIDERVGYEDMAGVVRYLLSHSSFVPDSGRQTLTWFGDLHATNFCPDPAQATERKTVPDLGPLSSREWRKIQKMAERIVGSVEEESEGLELLDEEMPSCPCDGCDGDLRSIFEWPEFKETNPDCFPREDRHRVETAYEWRMSQFGDGDMRPPAGLKRPQSKQEWRESFEYLVGGQS